MLFLGLRKLGNICCGHKMFLNKIRNIFCVPHTKFVPPTNVARAGKRGNICAGNNVSATMCPLLPGPFAKQKVQWTEKLPCTCVIILRTFLCRPLQNNNVHEITNSALSEERELRRLMFLKLYFKVISAGRRSSFLNSLARSTRQDRGFRFSPKIRSFRVIKLFIAMFLVKSSIVINMPT